MEHGHKPQGHSQGIHPAQARMPTKGGALAVRPWRGEGHPACFRRADGRCPRSLRTLLAAHQATRPIERDVSSASAGKHPQKTITHPWLSLCGAPPRTTSGREPHMLAAPTPRSPAREPDASLANHSHVVLGAAARHRQPPRMSDAWGRGGVVA